MAVQATANAGEVVTIVFGCSQRLPSPWTFSMPWGQAPVDALLGIEWLANQELRRAGLLWDTAWHGEEWRHFIEIAAARFGVELIGHCRIPALVIDDEARERQYEMAREGVAKLRELNPNAIIMATSHGSMPFVTALSQSGWDIPKMKVGAGLGGGPLWEGWIGTTILDDNNERAQRFLRRYDERFGPPDHEDMLISVHDGSRALLEAITLAPIMTREGVRTGMERVTMLPATAGASSTVITFGPYDHRGYKGRDVSVLRRSLGDGPLSRWPMEPYYSGEAKKYRSKDADERVRL
jgi:branched-chain amino acid transport system substrate-binding protein